MKDLLTLSFVTAFAALSAGAASAQITPEEVWESWQGLATAAGQTITTNLVTRDGDTLVVEGLTMSMAQDEMSMNGAISEVRLRDKGDGTVEITMSDSYPMHLVLPPPAAAVAGAEGTAALGPKEVTLEISDPGLVITASGTAQEAVYDFSVPTLSLKAIANGGAAQEDPDAPKGTMEGAITGMTGKYLVSGEAGAQKVDSSFAADSVSFTFDGVDPKNGDTGHFTGAIADLTGTSAGNLVGMALMATNMSEALKAGFSNEGSFSYGASTFAADFQQDGKPVKIEGSAASGDLNFGIGEGRLAYGGGAKGVEFLFAGGDMPFPELRLGYSEAAFNLLMPIAKSSEPVDFALMTKLIGLKLPDELWAMFDPTGALPHDPSTVVIDIKGKVTPTIDLMDPVQAETMGTTPPGQLNALDVTELRANVAGAELTGSGNFTFDNTDMTTFEGMPAPTGRLDLKLTGGNGLLDKLVAMGMMTEDDAMGMRMMLSMFAQAGEGEDEMTSTLEFIDKGMYANGQRIK